MEYILKRSRRRKTISIEIGEDCRVTVRAPYWAAGAEIDAFVEKNRNWINKHQIKALERRFTEPPVISFTAEEIKKMTDDGREWLGKRTEELAELSGIVYSGLVVKPYKSKWGSCGAKGDITLNCLLMQAPEEIRDYVIVHELCHRREMNHSKKFWSLVEKLDPDYRAHRRWLRIQGREIIEKLRK